MPIRAVFATGQTDITVNGLHQWDYGQTLEIYANDLKAIVKVHFACAGMSEAVVRVCDTTSGKAVVSIPDRCLEQSAPITAWVFEEVEGVSGTTTKKITLPIEARTRPAVADDIPEDFSDQCAELIAAVNALIDSLKAGNVSATAELERRLGELSTTVEGLKTGTVAIDTSKNAQYASVAGYASEEDHDEGVTLSARFASIIETLGKAAIKTEKDYAISKTGINLAKGKTYIVWVISSRAPDATERETMMFHYAAHTNNALVYSTKSAHEHFVRFAPSSGSFTVYGADGTSYTPADNLVHLIEM